jgi:hypothetical protein
MLILLLLPPPLGLSLCSPFFRKVFVSLYFHPRLSRALLPSISFLLLEIDCAMIYV